MLQELFDLIKYLVKPVLSLVLIGVLVIGGSGLVLYKVHEYKCEAKATTQNMEYDYGLFKGCMVKTENGWMDYNKLIYKMDIEDKPNE